MNLTRLSLIAFVVASGLLTGCDTLPVKSPKIAEVFDRYDSVVLGQTDSTSALATICNKELGELSAQSESAVASWASRGDDLVVWFNLVAFDEDDMLAGRKYAMLSDQLSPGWKIFLFKPSKKMQVDFAVQMDPAFLAKPFASKAAMHTAALEKALATFNEDARVLKTDSQILDSAVMATTKAVNNLKTRISAEPALAVNLADPEGIEFDHMNLGTGRARMIISDNVLTLKIKIGSYSKNFQDQPDVKAM